jgi:aminopeptidase N
MRPFRSLLLLSALALAAACDRGPRDPEPGVSQALAEHRAATISDLRYDLQLQVPAVRTAPVTGTVTIRFAWADTTDQPLVLDFRGDSTSLAPVVVNNTPIMPRTPEGHVVIPREQLVQGENVVTLAFRANDEALNRQEDWMYALFVPDRASTAFPSFDQPDLKGRYTVTIDAPPGWRAIANGAVTARDSNAQRVRTTHAETKPIPTYLLTFAAGVFQADSAQRDGRWLTMYHRESDAAKVARNREAIYDLHATALRWLEEYTGIAYPFEHFAFLAVPSFQFGGMEHPGAVWYRASSLFLEESATQQQLLGRASLIAHETAHMWFGDLVTMRWFSDVWMKEVFANFFAAKIVEPSFPDVDHRLRFFLAHHPTAYGVDRTLGANPIRQPLENLRQAGSLYGAIIYQKAPVVMQQLERLVGADVLRDGLRAYLAAHAYGNATWPDLIAELDARTPEDLAGWSKAWVEEPWRPTIAVEWVAGELLVTQRDPVPTRRQAWTQDLLLVMGTEDGVRPLRVRLDADTARVAMPMRPAWVLPGAEGVSYGRFLLDDVTRRALLVGASQLAVPVWRATAYHALYEGLLAGETPPGAYLDAVLGALDRESDELLLAQLLGQLRGTYWRFLTDSARVAAAPGIEARLSTLLERAEGRSRKSALWQTYVSVAETPAAVARLEAVWAGREAIAGLPLAEPQLTALAEALALREVANADSILDVQRARITDPDRQRRFDFVRPALSADAARRDSVVASFAEVANRGRETWVTDAVGLAAHPRRRAHAERYVADALALVPEIQRTGDIFFPLAWLEAHLGGQQSAASAAAVVAYLDGATDLPPRLRGKVLQAADDLFRAARVVEGWEAGPRLEHDPPAGRR